MPNTRPRRRRLQPTGVITHVAPVARKAAEITIFWNHFEPRAKRGILNRQWRKRVRQVVRQWKADIRVRDPRPSRPPARKRKNYQTQASGGFPVTFKCYDTPVPETFRAACP